MSGGFVDERPAKVEAAPAPGRPAAGPLAADAYNPPCPDALTVGVRTEAPGGVEQEAPVAKPRGKRRRR